MKLLKRFYNKNGYKKTFALIFISLTIIGEILNCSVSVLADSASTLGSREALGSPILNNQFSTEDWDKWEMVVWGIYLSNYCVPLVDTYESAFSTSASYGSKGDGLRALEFGSGNDPSNNKVIQQLLTAAINYQNEANAQSIYVSFTKISDGQLGEISDPNAGGTVRVARFSDLFLLPSDMSVADGSSYAVQDGVSIFSMFNITFAGSKNIISGDNNYDVLGVNDASLPTFYVKNGSKYIKIFDYTDAWDIQIAATMLNYVSAKSEYKSDFYKNYKEFYGSSDDGTEAKQIAFDMFGNIVVNNNGSNIMVIPSSVNKHLTERESINLVNSWVLNGSTQNVSNELVDIGKQEKISIFGTDAEYFGTNYGGLPAFSSEKVNNKLKNGAVILYKDSDEAVVDNQSNELNIGELIKYMLNNSNINNGNLGLKVETVNTDNLDFTTSEDSNGALHNTVNMSYRLSNILDNNSTEIADEIMLPSGKTEKLFDSSIMVMNQLPQSGSTGTDSYPISRKITNLMLDVYKGKSVESTYGKLTYNMLEDRLNTVTNLNELNDLYSWLFNYLKGYASGYSNVNYIPILTPDGSTGNIAATRYTIVYIPSQTLKDCATALGLVSGSEFSTFSVYIYVTYLNFYGINSGALSGEAGGNTTKLNKELYNGTDVASYDISNVSGLMSSEQKQQELLNMSYLMLSNTDEGKEYRKSIISSNIESWLTNQYNRIVYGSDSYNTTSVSDTGFANIASIDENPFTSGLIDIYSKIVIWLMVIVIISVIIVGIISGKNVLWYFSTVIIAVVLVLVTPSICNVSASVSNTVVQNIFSNKMTFWSINEQIADKKTDNLIKQRNEELGNENNLAEILDGISIVVQDRSLNVKKDISSKVNTKLSEEYTQVQQLKSARWILPILMQQVNGDEQKNDYVYVPVINMMDDASNMFLYYNDNYTDSVGTSSAASDPGNRTQGSISVSDRKSMYTDYVDTGSMTEYNNIQYRHYGYYSGGLGYDNMSHTYFYLLSTGNGSSPFNLSVSSEGLVDYTDIDSWQGYIDNASITDISSWETAAAYLDSNSDDYSRTDRSTVDSSYGYLWNSESVYNYMYQTVENTFPATESLGSLIGKLQGKYEPNSQGEEVRSNFMYATDSNNLPTGYSRDILDLQELISNNIPYMYKMWITAGGFDGSSGVLGDSKIEDNSYYKDINNKSWLFRCNWAIKIFENEDLTGKTTVRDSIGNRYEVDNMLIPSCYPDDRPMVFSEAQQIAYGLNDGDLSYVELKCVELNKETAISWTSLINYAGTSSIAKEILLRQMALDATFNFNKEFTTSKMSSTFQLYPSSLDLRRLSFDSIMKMIILNITKESSYIYGNTMETLIANTSVITSVILIITALICSSIVPLARNLVSLVVFALSIVAVLLSMKSDNRHRVRILAGTLGSQVVIIIINCVYYGAISLMISVTSTDEVLNIESVQASVRAGDPLWALVIVMILSILYIVAMFTAIKIFWQNRSDMGYSMYRALIEGACSKISDGVSNVGYGIRSIIMHEENTNVSNRSTEVKNRDSSTTRVKVVNGKKDSVEVNIGTDSTSNSTDNSDNEGFYMEYDDELETSDNNVIDIEIEKGSNQ